MRGAVPQVTCVFDHDAGFLTMTITFDPSEKLSRFPAKHRANNCFNRSGFVHCAFVAELGPTAFIVKKCYDNRNVFLVRFGFYQFRDLFVSRPVDNVEMSSWFFVDIDY